MTSGREPNDPESPHYNWTSKLLTEGAKYQKGCLKTVSGTSRMVGVSASVDLPCTIKSRSSLLAPAHPGGRGKRP